MASLMLPPPSSNDQEMRIDVNSLIDSPQLSIESGASLSLQSSDLGKKLVAFLGFISFRAESVKNQIGRASALENLDLGKTLMGLAFPAATGLVGLISQATTNHHELLLQLLTTGFAISFGASFMAVLLRQSYPRIANTGEILGAVSAVITFFTLVCCYVPNNLVWVLGIFCILCLSPFILLLFKSSEESEQLPSAAGLAPA
ncbi:uncharacterized protein LOC122075342 [Macadamia integrifolia]|uniref:uncharacterized protein LOC122075342 n=1 Tax=Macadamia integrifolia TaxID=60698 RepID=UPI001C4FF257|nr:uncharacterized protein LOC122075342 [Macadamia integrifolia]